MKPIEVEHVEPAELSGAAYNPRLISAEEMAKLQKSIRSFGMVDPIIARRDDRQVIGGHQRLEAYKALLAEGVPLPKRVPVVFLDNLSDARAKALNLALNKISGEWDWLKLADVLASIEEEDELTGFDASEVEDILRMARDPIPELSPMSPEEIASQLERDGLKMIFRFERREHVEDILKVLELYGMKQPAEKEAALLSAMRAAAEVKALPAIHDEGTRKRRRR